MFGLCSCPLWDEADSWKHIFKVGPTEERGAKGLGQARKPGSTGPAESSERKGRGRERRWLSFTT